MPTPNLTEQQVTILGIAMGILTEQQVTIIGIAIDIQKVTNLLPDEECYLNGRLVCGAEVHRIDDTLLLYRIPTYGVEERYLDGLFDFNEEGIEALVKKANSWT